MKEFQLGIEFYLPTIKDILNQDLPCWAHIPTDPDCEEELKLPIISDNENAK